ncbi:hypothetical protein N9359_04500 [Luminiphilus sp.]|nr:hypothetical protein [Luminiphilus sp.]
MLIIIAILLFIIACAVAPGLMSAIIGLGILGGLLVAVVGVGWVLIENPDWLLNILQWLGVLIGSALLYGLFAYAHERFFILRRVVDALLALVWTSFLILPLAYLNRLIGVTNLPGLSGQPAMIGWSVFAIEVAGLFVAWFYITKSFFKQPHESDAA